MSNLFFLFLLFPFYYHSGLDLKKSTLGKNTQPDNGDLIEYLPISEKDGLETSVLGLRFQVEPKHFRSGILELKCTATIGNGYWVTKKMVSQASINAQPSSPGHNRLLAGNTLSLFFLHDFPRSFQLSCYVSLCFCCLISILLWMYFFVALNTFILFGSLHFLNLIDSFYFWWSSFTQQKKYIPLNNVSYGMTVCNMYAELNTKQNIQYKYILG